MARLGRSFPVPAVLLQPPPAVPETTASVDTVAVAVTYIPAAGTAVTPAAAAGAGEAPAPAPVTAAAATATPGPADGAGDAADASAGPQPALVLFFSDTHPEDSACVTRDTEVRAAASAYSPDLWVFAGDMTTDAASDQITLWDGIFGDLRTAGPSKIRPATGNHDAGDYATWDAYWGANGGSSGHWYSFDTGAWHGIVLAANTVDYPSSGTAQYTWLAADLAASRARPTFICYHTPRWNCGTVHGPDAGTADVWALFAANPQVEFVVSGHEHLYQRFYRQTAAGTRDDDAGVVQFVTPTSALPQTSYTVNPTAVLAAYGDANHDNYGCLAIRLYPDRYAWQVIKGANSPAWPASAGTDATAWNSQAVRVQAFAPAAPAGGTGQAPAAAPAASCTALPGSADGAGLAYGAQPATAASVYAYPLQAGGTGQAGDTAVTASATALPQPADGTGTAYQAQTAAAGQTWAQPLPADGTGQAGDAIPSGAGAAAAATADGTGQAPDAAASAASYAPAAAAAGTGLADAAQPLTSAAGTVNAAIAEAGGAAHDAGQAASGTAPAAAADGTGQAPGAAPAAAATAFPAQADGTGTGHAAGWAATGRAFPGPADGTGQALDAPPSGSLAAYPGTADGAGAAPAAAPAYARLVLPGPADGTGITPDAAASITIAIEAAEAAGAALAAYIPPQVVFGRGIPGTGRAEHATAGRELVGAASPGSG